MTDTRINSAILMSNFVMEAQTILRKKIAEELGSLEEYVPVVRETF